MKNLILILLLIAPSLFAKNFMWEIKSETTKIYLLGSVHIANKSLYPLNPDIEKAYKESDKLVVEVDVDKVNRMEMAKRMMLGDSKSIKDIVTDTLKYNEIIAEFKKYKLTPFIYEQMKPWAAAETLLAFILQADGFTPQYGIDVHFMSQAKYEKKEILELESSQLQFDLLDKFSDLGPDYLLASITEMDKSIEQVKELFSAWKIGDTSAVAKIAFADSDKYEEVNKMNEYMLDHRNIGMLEKIEGYLETEQTYFVVVGSAHLLGEKGLLKLLEDKGYEIEQK